ncbi:mutagen-sensitive 312 isoform 1-T2 [Cochliomyia hominivorax]
MDRATRKANLKKLQLPNTSGNKQRKTRQTSKTAITTNTAITNYFLTPEKQSQVENLQDYPVINKTSKNLENKKACDNSPQEKPTARTRVKRTKLDAFLFKDPENIPDGINNPKRLLNDDDLEVPEKKVKKAPVLPSQTKPTKRSRAKKQATIKSAFLRNEQLFAEIAAQHCAADQFDGDDVQLALAISKSEVESKCLKLGHDSDEQDQEIKLLEENKDSGESIREKLQKYGFRTAEKNDYNTFAAAFLPKSHGRRLKCKWANKFTALTLRKPENQLKKIQEKVEKLLNSQFRTKPLNEQESFSPPYELQSSLLKKSNVSERKRLIEIETIKNKGNEFYFVTELFEVNNLSAGHLLKDWNAIQGRDLTPNTKCQRDAENFKKLENIYQELEVYFSSKKRLNWTIGNEDNEKQETNQTGDNEDKVEGKKDDTLVGSEQVKDLEICHATQSKNNKELDRMLELIQDLPLNENNNETLKISLNSTKEDKEIVKLLPASKSLDTMQVSSCSINTQATINSSQKNRSNSPDLFADSDVEMGEDLEGSKVETVINVKKNEKRNSSIEDVELGVTTYEIFSSDEVKNTSLSKPNKSCKDEESSETDPIAPPNDNQVIDLTQDDLEVSTHHQTYHKLNQSKPIIEIDIFAESPSQEEDDNDSPDININSKTSKCMQQREIVHTPDRNNQTFQLPLSLPTQNDTQNKENNKNISPQKSFEFTLSSETPETYKELNRYTNKEESFKFTLSPEIPELCEKIIKNHKKVNSKKLSLSLEICPEDTKKEESFKLTLSLETPNVVNENEYLKELEENEDIVLREIAMDQTNTSFFNFQGSKQLETCFHKETAVIEKEETIMDCLTGNDTIFQELCNKYLKGTSNNSSNLQKTDKSFTQLLPPIKTPQKNEYFTQFTMDFDMTVEDKIALKRKSTSFTAKTPLKMPFEDDINTKLSKSYSFNNSKMENVSIDLTQNDDDDDKMDGDQEDEDDCLVLSDDEINYSIWQANKTINFKTSEQSDQEEEDVISIKDNQEECNDVLMEDYVEEFSNKIDKHKSVRKEESYSDFEFKNSKNAKGNLHSPSQDDLKFDRSEFGILEEYSEPIDYTPTLCTPTKVLQEASFLTSPSETTVPMKRYSNCQRSSQKFQDLIKNIDNESFSSSRSPSININNDFDEFDRLVCISPFKAKSPPKKPQGIEQLLTAEISLSATKETPKRKSSKSTTPCKPLTVDKQEIVYNNKTYIVRSVNTPKPDYTKYTEAELLKELYNFGIKPLKRKQAVKMLEYIYNQTHPIVMEEENDNEYNEILIMSDKEMDFNGPSTTKEAMKTKTSITKSLDDLENFTNENKSLAKDNLTSADGNKLNLQDSCGFEMLRYTIDLKAELFDEQYILQTNVTKKTPQPLLPFHIAWYNLVCSNRKLHETILMYEPIDLQEIYLFLKGLGYRYDPKELKIFFDRRCIIFRYDLTAANNDKTKDVNRHVRKAKKPKVIKK